MWAVGKKCCQSSDGLSFLNGMAREIESLISEGSKCDASKHHKPEGCLNCSVKDLELHFSRVTHLIITG